MALNLLQLVPLAITIEKDGVDLYKAVADHSKAEMVAAVEETLPLLSQLSGKDEATLREFINPNSISMAYDAVEVGTRLAGLIEAAIAAKAVAAAAAVPHVEG